jgi:hypothetical protein
MNSILNTVLQMTARAIVADTGRIARETIKNALRIFLLIIYHLPHLSFCMKLETNMLHAPLVLLYISCKP